MSRGRDTRPRSAAGRIYRFLLRTFPRHFRRRYAEEMLAFFEDAWAEARGKARVRVVVRALRDVAVNGILERTGGGSPPTPGRRTMAGWTQDLRFALRALRRRPGFAAVAVLTLTLGIGTSTAVFSVVDAVVLRPLPYPDPDRLVAMWTGFDNQGDTRFGTSLAESFDYAEETRAFDAMGGFVFDDAALTGLGPARRIPVVLTWGDLYAVTGIRARLGRLPDATDAQAGAAPVAVVTSDFWQKALAADPQVVGRTVELDAQQVEIVGVLEQGALLPSGRADVWMPIRADRASITDRSGHWLDMIAHLSPSADLAGARREMEAIQARWHTRWAGQHSPGIDGHRFAMAGLHERYFGALRPIGVLLLGSVVLVMLLACANVASLLLAQGQARQGELSVRWALGAGRLRLVRQLLVEGFVLAAAGGLLGLLLAWVGGGALMSLEPGDLPRTDTVGMDGGVAAFAVGATLLCGLLFSGLPALRAGSSSATRVAGRRSVGPDAGLSRSLSALVVGQVGLAVTLLVGAGLLVQSLRAVANADSGVETRGRLTMSVSIPGARYTDMAAVSGFWDRLVRDVRGLPGVVGVAVTRRLPLRDGLRRETIRIEGREDEAQGEPLGIGYQAVTPGYFELMGVRLAAGRTLREGDGIGAPLVGVVNEAAARTYWPDGGAVGARVSPGWARKGSGPVTVVGVVADVHSEGVREATVPELYLPYAQLPDTGSRSFARGGVVVVGTDGAPAALAAPVRQVVQRIDPEVPVSDVRSFDEVAAQGRARERFLASVMGVFAVIATLIAAVGAFGVVAYVSARRTREYGLRAALGAGRSRLVSTVLGGGVRLALLGALLGGIGAALGTPLLARFLFGVSARDPLSFLAGPILIVGVVVVASAVPALRAGRIDPVEALREEP